MKLDIRHQTCKLLPEKAVYWEDEKILILADIHLGKEAIFQKAGIPISSSAMIEDLQQITTLIDTYKPQKCIIVGDLIHAKISLTSEVTKKFSGWLQNSSCEIHLVVGNHDRSLVKDLPPDWPLHLHLESFLIEPFLFSHYPKEVETYFVWSGHLHPKFEIGRRKDKIVVRCFQIFPNQGILPAFGTFTGGTFVKREKGCRIFGIVESQIIEI